jgi:hypothetical protein
MEASCSPKFPKLCVTNPWQPDIDEKNQRVKHNAWFKIFLYRKFFYT